MTNDGDAEVKIHFCSRGEQIITWNQAGHVLNEGECGLVALREEEPIGSLVWSTHDPHEGPQSWLKRRYVYLRSAWIHPQHRGRGIIALLADALLSKHPHEVIHGAGPGATLVTAFIHNRQQPYSA